jgi:maleate cis-trans isomerase
MAVALRVGLLVPASNTTLARELAGWLPAGSTVAARGIPNAGILTHESLVAYASASLAEARLLPPEAEVVAYGCMAAGFLGGPGADRALAERIAEATGRPVVTTAAAMVAALGAAGIGRVDLVTPYAEEVNAGLVAFLAAFGIAAGRIGRLPAPDVAALSRLTAADVAAAVRSIADGDGEAIVVACTQLPTAEVLAPLSRACGKPVMSANRATALGVVSGAREAA